MSPFFCIGTHNSVKLLLQTECQVVQAIIRAAILVVTICLPLPFLPIVSGVLRCVRVVCYYRKLAKYFASTRSKLFVTEKLELSENLTIPPL